MALLGITFLLFSAALGAMATGIVLGRPPISGSCGGLGKGTGCELCSPDARKRCATRQKKAAQDQS